MDMNRSGSVTPPLYKDSFRPVEERVRDLLERMTLEEKVRQMDQYSGVGLVDRTHPVMHNCMGEGAEILWDKVEEIIGEKGVGCIHDLYGTPGVNNALQKYAMERTRLGIPILFSEEALHGLCRPGSSIFPQQLALAAAWSPETVRKVGRCIAAETRSLGIHEVFSPVVDLARDPRWGRMEETYGEDTYLSSRTAVAMVEGLQGEDISRPDSVIAEVKHFSGYGIAEGGLNCAPVRLGRHEHQSAYLPVFEAAFREAGAVNAMCSYSAIDGFPCASDRELLTGVLRNKWKMRGFVRADMCAILRLYDAHYTAESPEEAIRQAVEAGVDMQYYDFPHDFYQNSLIRMVQDGRMKEETINTAVSRILRVKFLLGLFDRPYAEAEAFQRIILCKSHTDTALDAARKSICLLKNKDNLLPLGDGIRTIAVIGPNADAAGLGDYTPWVEGFKPVTVLEGIRKLAEPYTRIIHAKGCGTLAEETFPFPAGWLNTPEGENGLRGEYFNSADFSGDPVLIRTDEGVSFNWVFTKPSGKLTGSRYSVRWTGSIMPEEDYDGLIGIRSYDSMRLWIGDELVMDGWGLQENACRSISVRLEKGGKYAVRLEYLRDSNGAQVFFGMCRRYDGIDEAVEAARSADVAILVLGDSAATSGENFDRCSLDLPGIQQELLKAVVATGTPAVLVLQSGRALSLAWEAEHVPAILEAWFGGEKAGQAVAEALFGEINPAGRLPVSFPRSIGQLPVYYSRKPGGGVRYVEGDWSALFPFGYGLSYTEFAYSDLSIEVKATGRRGEQAENKANGQVDGDIGSQPDSQTDGNAGGQVDGGIGKQMTRDAGSQAGSRIFSRAPIKGAVKVAVLLNVKNIGQRAGDEVVQLYLHPRCSSTVQPLKALKGFRRIGLEAGESCRLTFLLGRKELQVLDRRFRWAVEPGGYDVYIGPDSSRVYLEGSFEL